MQSSMPSDTEALVAFGVFAVVALIGLFFTVIMTLAWCKVCAKAGYSWALGLLSLVPLANLILMLYLAFADWPVLQELRQLRPQGGRFPS